MFRISIPVKVLVVAALSYVSALFFTAWLEIFFKVPLEAFVFGLPLSYLFTLFHLFTVVVAAALATYYFLDRPMAKLTQAMIKAGEGDFLIRAKIRKKDEIGILAENFNQMLMKITDLSARKIETEHDLTVAQEDLKFKKQLEEKNRQIEKTNRKLENLVKDLSLLYEIGQGVNQTIDSTHLYAVITDVLRGHLRLENFSLMVWDEKEQGLRVKAFFGFEAVPAVSQMTLKMGEGIAGEVLKGGRAIYIGNLAGETNFIFKGFDLEGCLLSIPLTYKNERLGVINFGRTGRHAFTPHDIKMLTLVGNQVALAMANARLYTQTRELSVTDELTGVFNRRQFGQVLHMEWKRAIRFQRDLSLLMIDVDHFKNFNDTYGHLKGDEILRNLGRLLIDNLREVDTVARFGGEEFVILLPDTDKNGAMAVAEKLRHLVQEKNPGVTISVGVAHYPEDVAEVDDLIDHADIALYDAKDAGRNKVFTYKGSKPLPAVDDDGNPKPPNKPRMVH